MIRAIVAVDEKWGIGKNNDLLFHLPLDMKFFRETTLGKVVIMGSNTLKSFPGGKPLPKRTNVVLYPGGEKRDDCVIVESLDEMREVLRSYVDEDIYVIGGAMFYRTMLPYCGEALVTKVNADGGAQVFFENLDEKPGWECVKATAPLETEDVLIRFTTYRNRDVRDFFQTNQD